MGRNKNEGSHTHDLPVTLIRQLQRGSFIANKTQTWLLVECLRRELLPLIDEFRRESGKTEPIDLTCDDVLAKEFEEWVRDRDIESEERLKYGICSRRNRERKEAEIAKLMQPPVKALTELTQDILVEDGEQSY